MSLCYVDNVLVISEHTKLTIEGIKQTFRLKGENGESPILYLRVNMKIVGNDSGYKCWTMSSEDYAKMAVQTAED